MQQKLSWALEKSHQHGRASFSTQNCLPALKTKRLSKAQHHAHAVNTVPRLACKRRPHRPRLRHVAVATRRAALLLLLILAVAPSRHVVD